MNLFCFPFSGGSGHYFFPWKKNSSPSLKIFGMDYPGRGKKFSENPSNSFDELIKTCTYEIIEKNGANDFILYGHSFGAQVAYFVAKSLFVFKQKMPKALVLSGSCPDKKYYFSRMKKEEVIDEMKKMGGLDKDLLNNEEFLEYSLNLSMIDFRLADEYDFSEKYCKIDIPIFFYFSNKEHLFSEDEAKQWALYAQSFKIKTLKGDHFFINDSANRQMILFDLLRSEF